MIFERARQEQFSLWVPAGDPEIEEEYFLAANQAQHYIQEMLKGEISPDELVEGLADFLPVPVENYVDEVEENLRGLELLWGIPLTD